MDGYNMVFKLNIWFKENLNVLTLCMHHHICWFVWWNLRKFSIIVTICLQLRLFGVTFRVLNGQIIFVFFFSYTLNKFRGLILHSISLFTHYSHSWPYITLNITIHTLFTFIISQNVNNLCYYNRWR